MAIGMGLFSFFHICHHLVILAPFVEDSFFFPVYNFSFFVKNQVFICVWMFVRVFNSIPLIHMIVFMPIPSCFYYYSSIVELEVSYGDASRSSFILQDCFGYTGCFIFPWELKYCSLEVYEEFCWHFNGYCIESVDWFW